jgi:murein DD-endopeptidase MepM/ murein hydrolase activator NlpD
MNIAATALEENSKFVGPPAPLRTFVGPPAPLRTSLMRPDFGQTIGKAGFGLEPAALEPVNYEVQRGDNLWKICKNHFRDLGQSPSKSELYKAVQSVAKANGLKNPDLLKIGQALDLTSARGAETPVAAPIVVAKATTPKLIPTAPDRFATSSIKSFSSPALTTPSVPTPSIEKALSTAGVAPAANAIGGSTAALLASSQQAIAAKAAASAFGGPDLRVLGATPPLVAADSVEPMQVASLPGRTDVADSGSKRPNLHSLMEKIGLGNREARIGLASPWRKILDGAARITSGFGVRNDPFTGRLTHHSGLDIAAKRGTRVFPMQDGEVTFSGWRGGYGHMVTVLHDDGLESTYGHNSKNLVNVGDRVTAETPLALVGSTGRSTGPHIHFEVRENGRAIDPVPLLEERSVKISQAL